MAVNIPLLRKAVEWAEAEAERPLHLREWDQAAWLRTPEDRQWTLQADGFVGDGVVTEEQLSECGTTYCIAGFVGQTLDSRYKNSMSVRGVHVSDFAAEALGLSPTEANVLFDAENDIETVRIIAEDIAGEQL